MLVASAECYEESVVMDALLSILICSVIDEEGSRNNSFDHPESRLQQRGKIDWLIIVKERLRPAVFVHAGVNEDSPGHSLSRTGLLNLDI